MKFKWYYMSTLLGAFFCVVWTFLFVMVIPSLHTKVAFPMRFLWEGEHFNKRVLVGTKFEASKTLLLKAFRNLKKIALNNQNNPCPQFWGRKWLHQFYGHLEKCVLSAGKTLPIKFLVLGGGYFGFFLGGGGADLIFMGAGIFKPLVL